MINTKIFSFVTIIFTILNSFTIANDRSTRKCNHRDDKRFHQNPPIENKLLRDVINNYEELHANCYKLNNNNFTTEFLKEHKHMNCKYLIYNMDSSGLGNRVMGFLSFYAVALLTDRVLLIRSKEYDITEAFCQPFRNSDWFIPMDFQLHTHQHKFSRPNIYEYSFSMDMQDRHPIIFSDSEQYTIPLLFANKNQAVQDKLHHWFPNKNVATVLIKYLLHPQNDIWEDIVHSWLINTRKGSEMTLGLQFRWGYIEPEKATCLPGNNSSISYIYLDQLYITELLYVVLVCLDI